MLLLLSCANANAQFWNRFDGDSAGGESTPAGWSYATGDGQATMEFLQKDGFATAQVDATQDQRNIWWALIRRQIDGLDMEELIRPDKELRVEARIRVSHAPRRVNLHFNHQRTTDYHSHLMEYDIPDSENWHTISMTTQNFDVQTGDQINAQMALMDWGQERYEIDIDYFKVDVVDGSAVRNDLGHPMPYHPTVPEPDRFSHHIPVSQDAVVDTSFPDLNFNDWQTQDDSGTTPLLAVSDSQISILRWNMKAFRGMKAGGPGLLELSTHSLQRSPQFKKDFGMVRVVEILAGDSNWDQSTVTLESLCEGQSLNKVLNTQMVIDYTVNPMRGSKSLFVINQQVMQRLINGTTLGLAIRPLGAVNASFYTTDVSDESKHPKLHVNLSTK